MLSAESMEGITEIPSYKYHKFIATLQILFKTPLPPLVVTRTRKHSTSPPGGTIKSTAPAIRALAARMAARHTLDITATMPESSDKQPVNMRHHGIIH
jgi:hypothetical protein